MCLTQCLFNWDWRQVRWNKNYVETALRALNKHVAACKWHLASFVRMSPELVRFNFEFYYNPRFEIVTIIAKSRTKQILFRPLASTELVQYVALYYFSVFSYRSTINSAFILNNWSIRTQIEVNKYLGNLLALIYDKSSFSSSVYRVKAKQLNILMRHLASLTIQLINIHRSFFWMRREIIPKEIKRPPGPNFSKDLPL